MKDYIEQANRTSRPGTYPTHLAYIDATDMKRTFDGFAAASAYAEKMKKAVFYGRDISNIPTIDPATTEDVEILHANLGVMGESGEFVEAETREDVLLEGGDLLWYMAKKFRRFGITFEEAMEANIEKLRKKFPDKFSDERANEVEDQKQNLVTS